MTLSQSILDFIADNAREAGASQSNVHDDLFQAGVLDSFSVVDLVALLEQEYGIEIPDRDVNAANFKSIDAIELYLESRKS